MKVKEGTAVPLVYFSCSGAENKLTMTQTYTKTFQCTYIMNKYPFDTQVFDPGSQEHPQSCDKLLSGVQYRHDLQLPGPHDPPAGA